MIDWILMLEANKPIIIRSCGVYSRSDGRSLLATSVGVRRWPQGSSPVHRRISWSHRPHRRINGQQRCADCCLRTQVRSNLQILVTRWLTRKMLTWHCWKHCEQFLNVPVNSVPYKFVSLNIIIIIIIITIITHADDSRGSKAFNGVCDSLCLFVCTIKPKRLKLL